MAAEKGLKGKGKNRKLFQGMGIGYVSCLITHIIVALLPLYTIIPFVNRLGGHTCHTHSHHGLMEHIFVDILTLTLVIIPVAILTYVGHKIVRYFRCKCADVHEVNICDECPHNNVLNKGIANKKY